MAGWIIVLWSGVETCKESNLLHDAVSKSNNEIKLENIEVRTNKRQFKSKSNSRQRINKQMS